MKKLLCLLLTLSFGISLSLPAFADVWIPPVDDDFYCEAFAQIYDTKEGRELINRYASEYLHAGVDTVYESTPDAEIASAVVRMICRYPERYEGVMLACGTSGCVGIPDEAFTACAESRFGRTLRAEDFFSCEKGYILVSESTTLTVSTPSDASVLHVGDFGDHADRAAHPRSLFAHAERCYYQGDGEYAFWFGTYETTGDAEAYYDLNDPLSAENAQLVGFCNLSVKFVGDVEATQFDASDFYLLWLETYKFTEEEVKLYNEPDPSESAEETEASAPFETVTEHGTPVETATVEETAERGGFRSTGTILLTAAVFTAAIGACVAILRIKKKKR